MDINYLRGNNYGLIWLKENLLGSILKCHVSIDRKVTDSMSVSTEKAVYKSTCKSANLHHLELRNSYEKSDFQTILNAGTPLTKVTE